jgi:hypothetical protein
MVAGQTFGGVEDPTVGVLPKSDLRDGAKVCCTQIDKKKRRKGKMEVTT